MSDAFLDISGYRHDSAHAETLSVLGAGLGLQFASTLLAFALRYDDQVLTERRVRMVSNALVAMAPDELGDPSMVLACQRRWVDVGHARVDVWRRPGDPSTLLTALAVIAPNNVEPAGHHITVETKPASRHDRREPEMASQPLGSWRRYVLLALAVGPNDAAVRAAIEGLRRQNS